MKKITLALVLVILTACSSNNGSSTVTTERVDTASLGEMCAGADAKLCGSGLTCKLNEDSDTGICVETVEHPDMECPMDQVPVCGKKGRQINGYLNACEAERHGAEILYERFCKVEDVVGQCGKQVLGVGNCNQTFEGFEFDGTSCNAVNVMGCDVQIPFQTEEACNSACL